MRADRSPNHGRYGHTGKRRLFAVVCLVASGLLAWSQRPASMRDAGRVSLLLTHVQASVGQDVTLGRRELVAVSILPVDEHDDPTGAEVTLPFSPDRGAPEVSPPVAVRVGDAAVALQIRCRYRVPGSTSEFVGTQRLPLGANTLEAGVVRVLDPSPCNATSR